MARRSGKGGGNQLVLLLVLLGLLGGVGAWNYQRNLAAEAQEVRPYRTVSEGDLETLIAAYEGEIAQLESRYTRARRQGAAAAPAGGDRFDAFEQAQQRGRAVREVGYRLSEREAALEELRKEQQRRAQTGEGLQRILKLAFTF